MIFAVSCTAYEATYAAGQAGEGKSVSPETKEAPSASVKSQEPQDISVVKSNLAELMKAVRLDWKDGRMSVGKYDNYWSHITALRKEIAKKYGDRDEIIKALKDQQDALVLARSNNSQSSFCDYLIQRTKANIAKHLGEAANELAARKKAVEYAVAYYDNCLKRDKAGLMTPPEMADALSCRVDARLALSELQASRGTPVTYPVNTELNQYISSLDKALGWLDTRGTGIHLAMLRCERLKTLAIIAEKNGHKDQYIKLQKQIMDMNIPHLASLGVMVSLNTIVNSYLIHTEAELALAAAKGELAVPVLERLKQMERTGKRI